MNESTEQNTGRRSKYSVHTRSHRIFFSFFLFHSSKIHDKICKMRRWQQSSSSRCFQNLYEKFLPLTSSTTAAAAATAFILGLYTRYFQRKKIQCYTPLNMRRLKPNLVFVTFHFNFFCFFFFHIFISIFVLSHSAF